MQSFQAARAVSSFNLGVFKEPRGFIKLLQFILAIFAFATATSNDTSCSFVVNKCPDMKFTYTGISYPYRFNSLSVTVPKKCVLSNATDVTLRPYGDWSAGAEFYVFVGVMAFLNCIGVIVLYVLFDDTYQSKDIVPLIDFVMSAVFVALWLISSSAFAAAVSNIKLYAKPHRLIPDASRHAVCGNGTFGTLCEEKATGNYATLDVSILFGFLNMLVWAGSLWFLWKETKWHKEREAQGGNSAAGLPPSSSGGVSPGQPQI